MAPRRTHFNINLGDTIYSDSEVGGTPVARTVAEKWAKYRLGLGATGALGASCLGRPLQPLGRPRVHQRLLAAGERRRDLRRRRQGVPRLLAGRVLAGDRALPDVPLGEAPRALLPRRALVPQREGDAGVRRRSRADRTAGGAQRVRHARATSPQSGPARLSRRDRRSGANDARRPPVRRRSRRRSRPSTATWKVIVNEVPIQQYYALPYDRWEGYAAERERLLRFLAGEREERRLPRPRTRTGTSSTRCAPRRSARRPESYGHLGGRHRPRRDEHVREGDRRLPRHRKAPARRSVRSSSSPRRRTGWACAAPRSTRTATRR